MSMRNRFHGNSACHLPYLQLLAWSLVFFAGVQGLAAQIQVIEPGSATGPTVFENLDPAPQGSCAPNLAELVPLLDVNGTPIGQVGCLVSGAHPAPPGSPAEKLQATTLSLLPVGPTLFRGRTFKPYDFRVSESSSGRASSIPAIVTAKIEIQGLMAAILEGRAGVSVSLDVLDVTEGDGDDAELIGSAKFFDQEIAGTLEPSVGVSLGGSLPEPSAEIGVGASIGIGGEIAFINDDASVNLPVLLQRGHTYRLQVKLESRAGVGLGGGIGLSSFYGPSASDLWDLMDFRDPRKTLETTAALLAPGAIDPSISIPKLIIPDFQIPGFEIEAASATIPKVSATIPGASVSFDGASARFTKRICSPRVCTPKVCSPKICVAGECAGPSCAGPECSGPVCEDVDVDSGTIGNVNPPFSTPPIPFEIPETSIATSSARFPGFLIPGQTIDLVPLFPDVTSLTDRLNLPSFEAGIDGNVVLGWIQPVLENALALSPFLETLRSGPGVSVESLSVIMEEDVFEIANGLTSRVGDAQTTVLDTVSNAHSSLSSTLNGTAAEVETTQADTMALLTALVEAEFDDLSAALDEWTLLNLQTKIEDNLAGSSNDSIGTFMLPSGPPHNGLLDRVRQVTDETVELMALAGQDVKNARHELSRGDEDFAAEKYKDAYEHYRKAYQHAVK